MVHRLAAVPAQTRSSASTATAEKNVDFSKFKTYSWTRGTAVSIKSIDERVVAAGRSRAQCPRYDQATSGDGDVIVGYGSLTRTGVDLSAKADPKEKLLAIRRLAR